MRDFLLYTLARAARDNEQDTERYTPGFETRTRRASDPVPGCDDRLKRQCVALGSATGTSRPSSSMALKMPLTTFKKDLLSYSHDLLHNQDT